MLYNFTYLCKMRRKYTISIGDVFDKWTIIDKVHCEGKTGIKEFKWLCKDEKGNSKLAKSHYLSSLLSLEERNKRFNYEDAPPDNNRHQMGVRKALFREYKDNSKKRNIEFNLNFEQFDILITNNCNYCGSPPMYNPRWYERMNKNQKHLDTNGIDRIDSNLGYTMDNCVSCCSKCNLMKNVTSKEDFLNQIDKIYNFTRKGSTTIPKGSTLQAKGSGNGVLPTKEEEDIV